MLPSLILLSFWQPPTTYLHTYPQGTVRFAFSASNTKEEIDRCIDGFRELFSV